MPNSPHICIVDDDESVRESLEGLMRYPRCGGERGTYRFWCGTT